MIKIAAVVGPIRTKINNNHKRYVDFYETSKCDLKYLVQLHKSMKYQVVN